MNGGNRVENQGSTARDHLANERTFLAWVRTALGLMGLGLLLGKIVSGPEARFFMYLSLSGIGGGAAMLLHAVWRYESVARALQRKEYVIARASPLVVGIAGALVAAAAVWAVISPG